MFYNCKSSKYGKRRYNKLHKNNSYEVYQGIERRYLVYTYAFVVFTCSHVHIAIQNKIKSTIIIFSPSDIKRYFLKDMTGIQYTIWMLMPYIGLLFNNVVCISLIFLAVVVICDIAGLSAASCEVEIIFF